jgi:hypothetical protein
MENIVRIIEIRYGSLDDPNFAFIAPAIASRPYDELVNSITRRFEIEEYTDEDCDHGFDYSLSSDGRGWALKLSVVGPFAAFARADKAWDEILTEMTLGLTEQEAWLIHTLRAHGFRLLGQEELERPVPLHLPGRDPGKVRVYHALFTETDGLPWDKDTLRRLGLI